MVPRAVLMKTSLRSLNTARHVNTAHPKTTVYSARPMQKAVNTARLNSAVVNVVRENQVNAVKALACWVWRPTKLNSASITLKRNNYVDARGRSKICYLKGGAKGGKITGKGTLKTGKLDFEDVYFVKELQFNLFSVSQMCDKKNSVLFTDTGCFVLSPDFKLADESQVLLKVPRKNNMYSVDMKNIVPKECLTCLVAKATLDESMLWHRRLGHVNFKSINKLVKENLVRGLPLKRFENDQTCVACLKGKKHKASFVTDDYSRFTWVFFLASKDETSGILKSFITEIENLVDKKVKIIRCDNRTEFKNRVMSKFCEKKGIKKEFSVAKIPQQNGVAEKRNRTLIENMVLVVKPHKKIPYELFRGKFDGKSDEGLFVGNSMNSKAFRVYNIRTRKVKENLHIRFLEDKPIIAGDGPKWLFDIDVLTKSMNYVPVVAGTNSNDILDGSPFDSSLNNSSNDEPQPSSDAEKKDDEGVNKESGIDDQERPENSTQDVNTNGPIINTISTNVNTMDMSNITTTYPVPSTPNTRFHKDHSLDHVIGGVQSTVQTRRMTKTTNEQGFISAVYEGKTHEDLYTCLFACFLSKEEPKKVIQALKDPSWIEAMQEELLQFKLQQVWTLVDLPHGKRAIGTKWVYRNKKDERVARIEAIRLFLAYASFKDFVVYQMDVKSAFLYGKIEEEVYVCQPPGFVDPKFPDRVYKVENALYGLHQAPRAWYETFSIYLLDNGFQRGQIDKTLFIKRFKSDILLVQMSSMGELTFFLGLQVTQKNDGIFISQDKYVDEILRKFGFLTVKTASTPMETSKPLMKDANAEDVDVHLYRSMIGSLMYLTSLRPDIMFVVCACARFQVTPKVSHLHVVKRIFRYLKGQPKLGLWYPKDSPFDLEAYTDSDYAGASLDRKSTTRGCQFLGSRLISWQCKKQTVVANSTTEAEYVAAASCYGQVLWIQNQMLDYGYNFMNTKIFIDNESTICIVKNLQFWATAKVKTVNEEVQIQALVDKKKAIITETSIRRDLQLADENGTECLPNATIFAELERMGYENLTQKLTFYKAFFSPQWKFLIHTILQCLSANTTSWNEFSSTMASAIICLATNQRFNFSKYIFDNMVKNLEGGVKFLLYPRFVQKEKPKKTKKQNTEVSQPSDPTEPMADETDNMGSVPTHSNDPLLSGEDRLKLNEWMELCTNLSQRVLNLDNTKTSQAVEIAKLKEMVKKLERRNKSRTSGLKRLMKVGRTARIESSEDEGLGDQEDASKQGRKISDIDADEDEVEVEKVVSTIKVTTASATITTIDELTLAQTLIEINAAKPKAVTTAATTNTTVVTRPKARGVVV
ncbi:putative ribonuclease H-like domain-containing protein [Tanacetum coccineum]